MRKRTSMIAVHDGKQQQSSKSHHQEDGGSIHNGTKNALKRTVIKLTLHFQRLVASFLVTISYLVLSNGLKHWRNPLDPLPRVIWVTSPNRTKFAPIIDTWSELNPGWQVVHHDDQQAEDFVCSKESESFCSIYKSLPLAVMRADIWRYVVLYHNGGVYSDSNAKCRVKIEDWQVDTYCGFWAGQESNRLLCQWVLAALPKHWIYKRVLELIQERFHNCSEHGLDMTACVVQHDVHVSSQMPWKNHWDGGKFLVPLLNSWMPTCEHGEYDYLQCCLQTPFVLDRSPIFDTIHERDIQWIRIQ